jgi:HEPN domain-containing protein
MNTNTNEAIKLLKRAKSNLSRGKESDNLDLREIVIEDLCFDLQQSAEKSIKSVLKLHNIEYPYTHSIAKLITLLEKNKIEVPNNVKKAVRLTPFAVEARYTDDLIEITDDIYKESVEIAGTVYNWAKMQIEAKK